MSRDAMSGDAILAGWENPHHGSGPLLSLVARTGTFRDIETKALTAVRTRGERTPGDTNGHSTRTFDCSLLSRLDREPGLLKETRTAVHAAESEAVYRLALISAMRDESKAAHIYRVGAYCGVLARHLGLPRVECDLNERASPLHDLGKIAIPGDILSKPGPLSPSEWAVMKQHTTIGAQLLEGSPFEVLAVAAVIARSHHERWDGSGYPAGLSGDDIPLSGRICALADVFDALTSKRPYKPAFTIATALRMINEGRGTHFDPELTDRFLECAKKVGAIRRRYSRHSVPSSSSNAAACRHLDKQGVAAVSR